MKDPGWSPVLNSGITFLSDSFCCVHAYMSSPWRRLCFVYLHVFFQAAAPWALRSTARNLSLIYLLVQTRSRRNAVWQLPSTISMLERSVVTSAASQIAFFLLKQTSNKSLCIRSTCLYCLELAQAATCISLDQAGVLQYPISLSFSILIATPPSLLRVITGCQRREDDSGSCIQHTDEM